MKVWLLLMAGGLLLTVGDIFQKEWINRQNTYFFWIGVGLWTLGGVMLAICYKYKNMAIATMIYIIFNVVLLVLVSWFYYGEKLTLTQIVGICLGMASIFLLEE